jgi:hypothetical protein
MSRGENPAAIFRVEEKPGKQAASRGLLGLLFVLQDGGSTFLRNVGELPHCMAPHPRIQHE